MRAVLGTGLGSEAELSQGRPGARHSPSMEQPKPEVLARTEKPAGVKPSLESRSKLSPSLLCRLCRACQQALPPNSWESGHGQEHKHRALRIFIHHWHQEPLLSVHNKLTLFATFHSCFGCISSLTHCYSTAAAATVPVF